MSSGSKTNSSPVTPVTPKSNSQVVSRENGNSSQLPVAEAEQEVENLSCNESNRSTTTEPRVEIRPSSVDVESIQNQPVDSSPSNSSGPIRVPGTYPPQWLPDHETDTCMACVVPFTIIKRRHHCRACGNIFCGDCCRQKAKLLYMDNKEARVCTNCFCLIEYTLSTLNSETTLNRSSSGLEQGPSSSLLRLPQAATTSPGSNSNQVKVQGVLKTSNQSRSTNVDECNTTPTSASTEQLQSSSNKQVIFADGVRPGTDLSETCPYPVPSSSSSGNGESSASFPILSRQNRSTDKQNAANTFGKRSRKLSDHSSKTITVCDELGYLPPIVINNEINSKLQTNAINNSNSLASLITNQFRLSSKKSIQASMESRGCPLNSTMKFEEISNLLGTDGIVSFLLLKDFYIKVKLISKICCIDRDFQCNFNNVQNHSSETHQIISVNEMKENQNDKPKDDANNRDDVESNIRTSVDNAPKYWCFTTDGLSQYGQKEIILVIDKDGSDTCVPRDALKIFLTLHELSLRRQSLGNLGNLLFPDGLFGSKDTAGLLFVQPFADHCMKNLVLPTKKPFLIALVLQRWEVPWSKVFPMRLLLRLGHKFGSYPYPIISYRIRDPVYYEVGHTIISILGDFRNFRYSMTHVDGLRVMLNKKARKVLVRLKQSCYQQSNRVLDSSNNEHVLAWSSCPFPEASGHLVAVQNEDGQYESIEYLKKTTYDDDPIVNSDLLGASFVIFSGALKVNQGGQSAKVSIVEDGLLIQIQSCTMSALKNAIHFMHNFDINCDSTQDQFDRVEINWEQDFL